MTSHPSWSRAGSSALTRGTNVRRASTTLREFFCGHPFAREKLLLRCKLYYIVTSLMERSLIALICPRFLALGLAERFHAYSLASRPVVTRNECILRRVFNKIHGRSERVSVNSVLRNGGATSRLKISSADALDHDTRNET